jgi:hypothetical protein
MKTLYDAIDNIQRANLGAIAAIEGIRAQNPDSLDPDIEYLLPVYEEFILKVLAFCRRHKNILTKYGVNNENSI